MDRRDHGIGFSGEEGEDIVGRLAFPDLADRGPGGPNPGEEGEWAVLTEREPDRRVRAARQGFVLGETGEGHEAAMLNAKPTPPMRRCDIPDIGDAGIGLAALKRKGGRRHAPRASASSRPSGPLRTMGAE